MERRYNGEPIPVEEIEGRTIRVGRGDMARFSNPGASFLVGPGTSMRLCDFRDLIDHAARKLRFYTVQQALSEASGKTAR